MQDLTQLPCAPKGIPGCQDLKVPLVPTGINAFSFVKIERKHLFFIIEGLPVDLEATVPVT
jgi:hypothetical protein